jgi:competence protein ComEC
VPLPEFHRSPALKLSIMYAVGIVVGRSVTLPPLTLLAAFSCMLGATCVVVLAARRRGEAVTLSLALLTFVAGWCHVCVRVEHDAVPEQIMNRPVVIEGEVVSWPVIVDGQVRCDISLDAVRMDSVRIPLGARVAVRLPHTTLDSISLNHLQYGSLVSMSGRLVKPSPARNPGEFSQSGFYFSRGIQALFFPSRSGEFHVRASASPWGMRSMIIPVRKHISNIINNQIGGEEGEFLRGIILGDRSGIPWGTREAFSRSGVAHVLAVSGTHVAIVAAFLFFAFEVMRLPRVLKIVVTGAGMVCFMLMTGSQPPVVRSTIMGVVILVGMVFRKRAAIYNSIGISALVLLVLDPRQLFDPGFQLSYGAVLSIVYGYPKLNNWIGKLPSGPSWVRGAAGMLRLAAVSAAALLGTLPITLITFGRVSIVGIVANIAIVPAVGCAIVLGLLTTILAVVSSTLSGVYAGLTTVLLKAILVLVDGAGALPFATMETGKISAIDVVVMYLGLILVSQLSSPPAGRRLLVAFLLAANIAVFVRLARADNMLKVIFIDVGQGDAVLVQFPDGRALLVDAGPRSDQFDAGKRIVGPLLRREGVSTIDLLVATHPHSDHIGGFPGIYEEFDVRSTLECGRGMSSQVYEDYRARRDEENTTVTVAADGEVLWDFPLGRLYILHPPHRITTFSDAGNLNNESVVIKLQYGEMSLLLEGDAEREAESRLVRKYGTFLRSSVLKVGHHGSITSTTAEFLHAVHPQYAVISVGRYNTFHHPSRAVLRRLHDAGAVVHRTDIQGALVLESDGTRWSVVQWQ